MPLIVTTGKYNWDRILEVLNAHNASFVKGSTTKR